MQVAKLIQVESAESSQTKSQEIYLAPSYYNTDK